MNQTGPNRSNLTELSNGPNWTKVDRMDLIELKWTEVDRIRPKLTEVD